VKHLLVAALALTLGGFACGGDGGGQNSGGGDLLVTYFQGGPEPGALLLTISGGPVTDVKSTGGQQVSFSTPFAGTTKVVVLGTLGNGDLLKITVPDVAQATSYTAHVNQAADKSTFGLLEPGRYTLTVHR
jgi:hypothetical protein